MVEVRQVLMAQVEERAEGVISVLGRVEVVEDRKE